MNTSCPFSWCSPLSRSKSSHLVGKTGQVISYEVESKLAERAAANLVNYKNVELRHGNAATDLTEKETFDLIVSFAGVTHIPAMWSETLAPDARLLLPLTGKDWWGAMILAEQSEDGFIARTLGRCGFYPCDGARSEVLAEQISSLFSEHERLKDCRLRITDTSGESRWEEVS